MLIAIDHGNYAIETPHTAFLSGMIGGKVAAEHQEPPAPAAPPVETVPAEPSPDVQDPETPE